MRHLRPVLSLEGLSEGLDAFYENRAQTMAGTPPREQLQEFAQQMTARELLLIRVQNFFLPALAGGRYVSGPIAGLTEDAYRWTIEQRNSFDYAGAAVDCGVSARELGELSRKLADGAKETDPNWELFHLLDVTRPHVRERVTGDARRGLDMYQAARVIRSWHSRLVDEPIEDVDEYGGWSDDLKKRVYRTANLQANRAALPAILEKYGLYPWRVQLIGEGDSELAALEEILKLAV